MDSRIETLAHNLVHYSLKVEPYEKVLIHNTGRSTNPLAKALINEVYKAKGIPFSWYTEPELQRGIFLNCEKEQLALMAQVDSELMKQMDCYVGIRGGDNVTELSDVPSQCMAAYNQIYNTKVHHEIRVPHTKWVVLRYPNHSMAQLANQSLEAFEDFYFNVCNLDYSKMNESMQHLKALMERTDKVHITGPKTDLTFSIKGIPAIPCAGEMNIPDGEVFTAPVKDSINGILTYNTPAVYQGFTFSDISLTFQDGKIIKATANDTKRINEVFDTDEGARYVGEFAIGVNPYIIHPMKDTLFDEKIMGSFHFTPGNCYEEAPNGNESSIHWDLVCIQTEEYGGGEIYFDDVLIRKNGRFVIPELYCLNPENLK